MFRAERQLPCLVFMLCKKMWKCTSVISRSDMRRTCEPRVCGRPESSPAAALWWCCGLPLRDRSRARALRSPSVTLPSRYPAEWYRRAPSHCNKKQTSYPVSKGSYFLRTNWFLDFVHRPEI